MGRKKKYTKGVNVNLWEQTPPTPPIAPDDAHHGRRSEQMHVYNYYDYRQHSGQPSVRTPPIRRYTPPVDPAVLRRVYLLQNFQIVIRRDVFDTVDCRALGNFKKTVNVPQGIRKIVEAIRQMDSMVPWEAVHSVIARSTPDDFQCPICLDTPTAARITECGHVFCLSCAMRYIDVRKKENKPRECPICHSTIHVKALRPCVLLPVSQPTVGERVRFDLFYRERHSCILRRFDDPHVIHYREVLREIEEMKAEAELQGDDDHSTSLEEVSSQLESLAEEGEEEKKETLREEKKRIPAKPTVLSPELDLPVYGSPYAAQSRYVISTMEFENQIQMLDASSVSEKLRELEYSEERMTEDDKMTEAFFIQALGEITTVRDLTQSLLKQSPPLAPRSDPAVYSTQKTPTKEPLNPHSGPKNTTPISIFELYAQTDGQPYFLHMVTMKMLRHDADHHRGGQLLDYIEAPIEEIVTLTQCEETRHVYKVFSSVPLHGVLKLCLLDLKDIVHPETLEFFAGTLTKLRDQRRKRKEKEDRSYEMHSEDASWKEYVERYNCNSSEMTYSESQVDAAGIPHLMLPSIESHYSDHGLPPNTLDTRQRATKRGDNLIDTGVSTTATDNDPNALNANNLQLVAGDTTTAADRLRETSPVSVPSRVTSNGCWAPGSAVKLFKK